MIANSTLPSILGKDAPVGCGVLAGEASPAVYSWPANQTARRRGPLWFYLSLAMARRLSAESAESPLTTKGAA